MATDRTPRASASPRPLRTQPRPKRPSPPASARLSQGDAQPNARARAYAQGREAEQLAAEALLANYRGNPKGERAPDSLFYLGQSLVALKQPAQACKAYAELEDVYGASMRADLKSLLPAAKSRAGC